MVHMKRLFAGRIWGVAAAIGLMAVLSALPMLVHAGTATPGSEDDPLIAKSYLDTMLPAMLSQYATRADLQALSAAPVFEVVNIPSGSIVTAEGGTEMILRAGSAVAITSEMGGISDVTAGVDIGTGTPIPKNHLLIVPRSDGRGFLAESDVVVIIRGPYQVR